MLPIERTLSHRLDDWFISDYAAWTFLLSNMPHFNRQLSHFYTFRPISSLFPDNRVIFGEAGCSRLCLPLSPSLLVCRDDEASAQVFASDWLFELRTLATKIKPDQTLVVLLTGHWCLDQDKAFQLLVKGESGGATIKAFDLGQALKCCAGQIVIISNFCESGALESELSIALNGKQWSLICAAGLEEPSEGGSSTTLVEPNSNVLLPLAKAFVKVPHLPLSADARYAQLCMELINEPNHPSHSQQVLVDTLHSRNVQTIAFQDMARRLGWWRGNTEGEDDKPVCHFLPGNYGNWREDRTRMSEYGMAIHLVAHHLASHFPK